MSFNYDADDSFNTDTSGTEIVLRHDDVGLENANEIPFGDNYFEDDDEATIPNHQPTSFYARNRNRILLACLTVAAVLFVSGTSVAVARNKAITSNFNSVNCVETKAPSATKAPKATKAPSATTAPKATKAPSATAAPKASKAPKTTKAPKCTKAPKSTSAPNTKTPKSTKAPTPVPTTPLPSVAPSVN